MIYDLPEHDKEDKLTPVSIEDDGTVSVIIGGVNYDINIKDISRIEY